MASRLRCGRAVLLVLFAALLPACSSNTPSIPGGVLRSALSLTVTPSPVTPNITSAPILSVQYTVKIEETAGLGGELQYVNGTIFSQATGAALAFNNYDSADIVVFVGNKRLEGGKSVNVSQQIDYVFPSGATSLTAFLTVAVQLKDDRGNFVNQSILVPVQ